MPLDDVTKLIQMTREFNEKNKSQLQVDAYQHRWKNLGLSTMFLVVMVGILIVGYWQRARFGIVNWYILTLAVSFLALFSLIVIVNYIVIIIKKK